MHGVHWTIYTRLWAANKSLVLLHRKTLQMPPDFFIHKFIEFPLYPLGHRCEPSGRAQSGVGVRSAKRPGQTGMVKAPPKWTPSATLVQRRAGWR